MLKNHASRHGYYETLLIRNNKLTEGSASNVFIVKDNIVHTPMLSNELLPGVTRDLLIDLLKDNNMTIIESVKIKFDVFLAECYPKRKVIRKSPKKLK